MPIVKTHINNEELYHDLKAMKRDNFSYEGAKALMEHLEELSDDIGENIEYDPIAFCCDYVEYSDEEQGTLFGDYGYLLENDLADYDDLIEEIDYRTVVISFDGGVIIQSF